MTTRPIALLLSILVLTGCSALVEFMPRPATCASTTTDLATIAAQDDPVACYGKAELTFDATVTAVIADCPGGMQPAWLGCGGAVEIHPPDTARAPAVVLAARTTGPTIFGVLHPTAEPLRAQLFDRPVQLTGHFDDPAAMTCHITDWPDNAPPPAADVIAGCRGTFVITAARFLDT